MQNCDGYSASETKSKLKDHLKRTQNFPKLSFKILTSFPERNVSFLENFAEALSQ